MLNFEPKNTEELSEEIYNHWTLMDRNIKDDSFTEIWGFAEQQYKTGNKQFLEMFLFMVLQTNTGIANQQLLMDRYLDIVG